MKQFEAFQFAFDAMTNGKKNESVVRKMLIERYGLEDEDLESVMNSAKKAVKELNEIEVL